jgi:hypothetical protein
MVVAAVLGVAAEGKSLESLSMLPDGRSGQPEPRHV